MKRSLIFLFIMLTFLATPMISSGEGEPGGKEGEDTVHPWHNPVSKSPLPIPIIYRKETQLSDDGESDHLTIPITYRKDAQLSEDGQSDHLTIPIIYRKDAQLSEDRQSDHLTIPIIYRKEAQPNNDGESHHLTIPIIYRKEAAQPSDDAQSHHLTIPIIYRKEAQLNDDGESHHLTIPIIYRKEAQLSDDGEPHHLTIPIIYRKEAQLSDGIHSHYLTIPIIYRKEVQFSDDGDHLTIPIIYRKEVQFNDEEHSPLPIPIIYKKEIQPNDEVMDMAMLFISEKDLKAGHKKKLHFSQSSVIQSSFLPRQLADSIPFSSSKLDEILERFGIKPGSKDAENIKQTLVECELEGIKGEKKHCATSLEAMVDFATSKLGEKSVESFSTVVVAAAGKENYMQDYTIVDSGVEKVSEEKAVVCHKDRYPYAVFYCHKLDKTSAFIVALKGADGTRVKAVAVCHHDTSQWHPKNLAFQVLKVKPGTVPATVCHFLPPQDHIVWVPKRTQIL